MAFTGIGLPVNDGAEQVQSDFLEDDSQSPAFILNRDRNALNATSSPLTGGAIIVADDQGMLEESSMSEGVSDIESTKPIFAPNIQNAFTDDDQAKLGSLGNAKFIQVLESESVLASQSPATTGVELQVEFGSDSGAPSDPVQIDSSGLMTINDAGDYIFRFEANLGRTTNVGVAICGFRIFSPSMGVQVGRTVIAELQNSRVIVPIDITAVFESVLAGTTVSVQFIRDISGINAGVLEAVAINLSGWDDSTCAKVTAHKLVADTGV